MKRFFCLFAVIIMLAVSLLGCSQGEMNDNGNSNADSQSNINEPAEETAESRGPEDDNEKADKEIPDEWVSTELFGVPQETEEYILHEDIYPDDIVYDIYMELHDEMFKNIRGYYYSNRGWTEGFDILAGSRFFIIAGYGGELRIKSIEDRNNEGFIYTIEPKPEE